MNSNELRQLISETNARLSERRAALAALAVGALDGTAEVKPRAVSDLLGDIALAELQLPELSKRLAAAENDELNQQYADARAQERALVAQARPFADELEQIEIAYRHAGELEAVELQARALVTRKKYEMVYRDRERMTTHADGLRSELRRRGVVTE